MAENMKIRLLEKARAWISPYKQKFLIWRYSILECVLPWKATVFYMYFTTVFTDFRNSGRLLSSYILSVW